MISGSRSIGPYRVGPRKPVVVVEVTSEGYEPRGHRAERAQRAQPERIARGHLGAQAREQNGADKKVKPTRWFSITSRRPRTLNSCID